MPTENLTPDSAVDQAVETRNAALAEAEASEAVAAASETEALEGADAGNLDMLMDVSLKLTVELGRSRMKIRDILNLASGSVVPLEKQASEPVDILVNGALLASGEVVVIDDQFAVRITKLLSRVDRLKKLV